MTGRVKGLLDTLNLEITMICPWKRGLKYLRLFQGWRSYSLWCGYLVYNYFLPPDKNCGQREENALKWTLVMKPTHYLWTTINVNVVQHKCSWVICTYIKPALIVFLAVRFNNLREVWILWIIQESDITKTTNNSSLLDLLRLMATYSITTYPGHIIRPTDLMTYCNQSQSVNNNISVGLMMRPG